MNRFSDGYVPKVIGTPKPQSSVAMVLKECARQHIDALETFHGNDGSVDAVAAKIRAAGSVTLLGMGASHHANLIAAARLRTLKVSALAIPASEALYAPLPDPGPVILTTQSGGSVEIVRWLSEFGVQGVAGSVTLSADNPFGDLPTLLGHGGPEEAFAATRSFSVTLAALAALVVKLGGDVDVDAIPKAEPLVDRAADEVVSRLSKVKTLVFSGRSSFEGLAQLAALSAVELSRQPAFALEGGQLRHGPVEMLGPDIGVVVFRGSDSSAKAWNGLSDICRLAKAPFFVFDSSHLPALEYGTTMTFHRGAGIRSIYDMLPTLQSLVLGLGAAHVKDVGTPLYCNKVTSAE